MMVDRRSSSSSGGGRKHPPIYVLDDDEVDDEDEVAVVGGTSSSSSGAGQDERQQEGQRRRRGGAASAAAAAAAAAAGHSVVDLTSSDNRPPPPSGRGNAGDEEEVEFVGTSSGRAAAAQLSQYRAEAAGSYVQFVGAKRSRPAPPAPAAAAAAGPIDRFDAGRFDRFGFGGGGGGTFNPFGSSATAAAGSANGLLDPDVGDLDPLDYIPFPRGGRKRRSSPSATKRKTPKKRSRRSESPPPMEKGKSMHSVPTGFDALDMYYPHLKAADRTAVMYGLLPEGYTKKWTHEWRVAYDKKHPKATLWSVAAALSDQITGASKKNKKNDGDDGDKKMPAKKQGSNGKENQKPSVGVRGGKPIFPPTKKSRNDDSEDDDEDEKLESVLPTPSIGPLSGEVIDTLRTYFRAHVGRVHHKAYLDSIQPVDVDGGALTCSICADTFDATDTVPCSGEDELHFFCKSCFASYATVTVQSGPVQSITCPMPGCDSLFATADAKANLSEWDLLMIEHRETSRDRRVALAAKAVLHCECGVVGIITEEDVGNGRVVCPGEACGRRYCCKCGNDDHGTEPCPPPAETVQWLDEHSKECPNCMNRIEKNGGCDHMTCATGAGGCGYEFWWTCGCPYKGQHRPECKRLGERMLG